MRQSTVRPVMRHYRLSCHAVRSVLSCGTTDCLGRRETHRFVLACGRHAQPSLLLYSLSILLMIPNGCASCFRTPYAHHPAYPSPVAPFPAAPGHISTVLTSTTARNSDRGSALSERGAGPGGPPRSPRPLELQQSADEKGAQVRPRRADEGGREGGRQRPRCRRVRLLVFLDRQDGTD